MAFNLSLIKTVFIVMMENRSFDHLLGYLSLAPRACPNVNGLRADPAWLNSVASIYGRPLSLYPPFEATDPYDTMRGDPPHERDPIAVQIGHAVEWRVPDEWFCDQLCHSSGGCTRFPRVSATGDGLFHQGSGPGD